MMREKRLLQWDRLELRIGGERLVAVAKAILAGRNIPVELEAIRFLHDDAEVTGAVRKGLSIPFRFHLGAIEAEGLTVRIPIERLTVLGFVPVPSLLFRLAEGFASVDGVEIDPARKTIVLALDRFLPEFLDVEIIAVRPVAGGMLVTLGGGGADLPPDFGGLHG
ncbi:MAG TPA: hypothetical protein VMS56_12465 [Thermoanaerobaculia bacterium]|nr:hypothetical protein [Thermoanaerobaculia bacterium]